MNVFSTALTGAIVGCFVFSVSTSYLSSCADYYHEVNQSISKSYGECHSISQACLEASAETGDHTSCLLTSGWQQANERYLFQQRKSDKMKYHIGRVVELVL